MTSAIPPTSADPPTDPMREALALAANADRLRLSALIPLAAAAQSFDAARGVPFSRYAARRIKGALLDELRE